MRLPEDIFISHINKKLEGISKLPNKTNKAKELFENIHSKLSELKKEITELKEKYAETEDQEALVTRFTLWENVRSSQKCFIEKENAYAEKIEILSSKIAIKETRTETLNEMIATLSAHYDNGVSEAAVLACIQATVITNAALSMLTLSDAESDSEEARRACVMRALNAEVSVLTEMQNPAVLAMWENQKNAVDAFITEFLSLETLGHETKSSHDIADAAWKAISTYTDQRVDIEREDEKLDALEKMVLTKKNEIIEIQKKIKAPIHDYELEKVMKEINEEAEKLFFQFKEAVKRFDEKARWVYSLAEEKPPSPSESESESESETGSESEASLECSDSINESEYLPAPIASFFSESQKMRKRSRTEPDETDDDLSVFLPKNTDLTYQNNTPGL